MRYFLIIFAVCVLAVAGVLGKRGSHFRKPSLYIFPDMEWQLKLRPQKENSFFTNGLSSQLQIPGTIARSSPLQTVSGAVFPYEDAPVNTGRITGTWCPSTRAGSCPCAGRNPGGLSRRSRISPPVSSRRSRPARDDRAARDR